MSSSASRVQALVARSRRTEWQGSAKHTPRYRHFDTAGQADGAHHFGGMFQVATSFDEACYANATADGASGAATNRALKPGPLMALFRFYARLFSARTALRERSPTYAEIYRATKTMVFGELLSFARDFDLVPSLLSKGELYYVFRKTRRFWCEESSPILEPSSRLFFEELKYDEFEECLARIALLVYARPGSPHVSDTPRAKVSRLVDALGVASLSFVKRRLATVANPDADIKGGTTPRVVSTDDQRRAFSSASATSSVSASAFACTSATSASSSASVSTLTSTPSSASPRPSKDDHQAFLRKRDASILDYSVAEEVQLRDTATALFDEQEEGALIHVFEPLRWQDSGCCWKSFDASVINMGRVLVGQTYRYRVRVTNTLDDTISLDVNVQDLPFINVLYSVRTVAAGLSRVVELEARLTHPGEHTGAIRLTGRRLPAACRSNGGAVPPFTRSDDDIFQSTIRVYADARYPRPESSAEGCGDAGEAKSACLGEIGNGGYGGVAGKSNGKGKAKKTVSLSLHAMSNEDAPKNSNRTSHTMGGAQNLSPRPPNVAIWPCAPAVRGPRCKGRCQPNTVKCSECTWRQTGGVSPRYTPRLSPRLSPRASAHQRHRPVSGQDISDRHSPRNRPRDDHPRG